MFRLFTLHGVLVVAELAITGLFAGPLDQAVQTPNPASATVGNTSAKPDPAEEERRISLH